MPKKAKKNLINWRKRFNSIKDELIQGYRKGRKENVLDDATMDSIMNQAKKQTEKEFGYNEREAVKKADEEYTRGSNLYKSIVLPKKKKKKTKNALKSMLDGDIKVAKRVALKEY